MPGVDALRLAVGTLTVLPAGHVPAPDRRTAGAAMVLAPLAVLPLAVAAAGLGRAAYLLGSPELVGGLVVVAVLALGTRALHLDGLADTADGLGSGWDTQRALEVMRRGDVGPMGVVALVLVLAGQVLAVSTLLDSTTGALLVGGLVCLSRTALVLGCRAGVPAARPDGLGVVVAGSVPRGIAVFVWLLVLPVVGLLGRAYGLPWWQGVTAAVLAGLAVLLLVRRCVRRFGGVSGDVLGAAVETAFTALTLVMALGAGR